MLTNDAATISAWRVLDTLFYVVRVVGADESIDGDVVRLRKQGSVVTDADDEPSIWLRELLLGVLEEL